MKVPERARREVPTQLRGAGFTLIEMMVVGSVLLTLAALGLPALQQMMVRSKLEGGAREISSHLLLARIEALKKGRSVVVVPDFGNQRMVGFVDDNENLVRDAGEEEIFNFPVPAAGSSRGVSFADHNGNTDNASTRGFTTVGSVQGIVFEADGSVVAEGAFRLSDSRVTPNVFEIQLAPRAAPRAEVRKFMANGPAGQHYYPPGGVGEYAWKWY